jgi:predicted dehydrogenase
MSQPRILVIGAGSIGTRHATNLADAGCAVHVMDPDGSRGQRLGEAIDGPWSHLDLDGLAGFDGVVLASPTVHHAAHLEASLATNAHVFVEKPMTASTDELTVISGAEDRVMVGFNLRFHRPIARMHELVSGGRAGELLAGDFWFGHWLPAWRPTVDYRDTYSAQRALGGGILMDAVHEIDLAVWFFGPELAVRGAVIDRLGPLDIDVEDTAHALLRDPGGRPVHVSLDYLAATYRRGIQISGTEATVRFDWDGATLDVVDATGRRSQIDDTPVGRSYVDQMHHFVGWIGGGATPPVDGRSGAVTVRLVDQIRQAAQ